MTTPAGSPGALGGRKAEDLGFDPVAANADSVTPVAPPLSSAPRLRDILRAGWVTGVTAALLCLLMRAIGTIFGTDFLAVPLGSDEPQRVAWWAIAVVPILAALVFSLVVSLLRGVRHCRMIALYLGFIVGGLSIAVPLMQPADVTWPTRIWLVLMHVVTIELVVPQVARVLGDSDPRVTAGYRQDA